MTKKKLRIISLFTGIGGLDMGFDGKVIVHKDSISYKKFIKKKYSIKNFVVLKKHNCFGYNNNEKYNTTSIYDLIKNKFVFPQAEIIIGGFPCQDFSHSGKRQGFLSNTSHDLKKDTNTNILEMHSTIIKLFNC
jgi:DNA (cytosine-5)-methyltransferase 1